MSKPDWAERLQRTFKRKYDLGYAQGHLAGWNEGFEVGSKKAISEAKKVFIKRLQKETLDLLADIKSVSAANIEVQVVDVYDEYPTDEALCLDNN